MRKLKGFISRYLYDFDFWGRRLTEYKAVCDICDCVVSWSDYAYMCKVHGPLRYDTWRKFFPKFIFRIIYKLKKVRN